MADGQTERKGESNVGKKERKEGREGGREEGGREEGVRREGGKRAGGMGGREGSGPEEGRREEGRRTHIWDLALFLLPHVLP